MTLHTLAQLLLEPTKPQGVQKPQYRGLAGMSIPKGWTPRTTDDDKTTLVREEIR